MPIPPNISEQKRRLDALRNAGMLTQEAYDAKVIALETPGAGVAPSRPVIRNNGQPVGANEAVAPYRFVELNDQVARPENPELQRNRPELGRFCGSINIEFEVETPLLIGADNREGVAMTLSLVDPAKGPWWIPGASLRGMIRSAAEIVGYARLHQTNSDYVFPLRDFEHPDYNDKDGVWGGRKLGQWDKVHAGWLVKAGSKESPDYTIYEAGLYYLRVSELVTLPGLITRQANTWIGLNLSEKYSQLKMSPRRFRPSGETKQKQPLVSPDPSGPLNGVVVVSGRSPRAEPGKEKKLEYVFSPFDDGRKPHALTSKSFDKFEQVHTKTGRGDERVAEGSWAELKKRFETKPLSPIPVFYTGDISNQGDDFAFGLTRLFKVPHRVKQGGMIKQKLGTDENQMDMVEALFGFVREGKRAPALKSRVAFSGAVISQEKAEVRGQDNAAPFETVMGTPKASFAPYYLEGKVKDWSVDQKMFPNNDTKIAGRKRYLPRAEGRVDMNHALENIRQRFQTQVDVLSDGARNATKTKSKMRFLVGKTGQPFKFESVIQLHNVSKAEIGLLLLAACFGGGDAQQKCRHMLGRAKPFGAGQLRVVTATLNIKENFDSKNFGDTIPTEAECLSALVAHMKTQGIESYPDTDIVREFLGSADPRNGKLLPGSSDTNEPIYLKLKEHQNMRQKVGKLKTSGASTTQTISVLRANKWKGTIGP